MFISDLADSEVRSSGRLKDGVIYAVSQFQGKIPLRQQCRLSEYVRAVFRGYCGFDGRHMAFGGYCMGSNGFGRTV